MKKRYDLIRDYAILLSISSIFALLFSSFVLAAASEPKGPNQVTVSASGRNALSNNTYVLSAEAGNVTALVITDIRNTEAWQGYYGNITGTITLDDANNYTLYDWDLPDPTGEVYASNGTDVAWTRVYCMNVSPIRPVNGTQGSPVYNINGSQIELNFGINVTDKDGLNETFNNTFTGSFQVGEITIDTSDGCSAAHPFTDEDHNTDWQEVLLSDNTSLIFTAIVRTNANSYQPGAAHTADFQMLVLENGHAGSETTPTNYYFYVELT